MAFSALPASSHPPSKITVLSNIIAISGLGGHAFGSFKERNGEHMWLRDALPHGIIGESKKPIASVMIYGYESSVPNSDSFQNLEDLGTALRSTLKTLVIDRTLKPIVFIAHSLGGLVVKELLISLSKSKDEMDQKLRRAVYGIAFFGVPHEGMEIRSLIPMAGDRPNRFLLESIGSNNSQVLSIQQREFLVALGGQGESEIFSFYETRMSPTAVEDKEGRWSMTGAPAILVSKSSATHCRPWEGGTEHTCAINRTHSDMVKFAEEDSEYDMVLVQIKKLVQQAITARKSPLQPNLSPEEQDCLKSLAFPQMHNRGNDIERAVEGTCKWLLQHKTYMSWATSHHGILWLKGKPGAGKSTLLKYALSKQRNIPSSTDIDLVLSFFFHGRGDDLQKTPLGFFQSLLHQILKQSPKALSDLVDTYRQRCREMGDPPEKWQWRPEELWCFFESSLLETLKVRPIWLFVDALDECGERDAVDLAVKFKSLLESSRTTIFENLHICFSCRHYPIPAELEGVVEICVEDQNKDDISTYVRNKISQCSVREASTIVDLMSIRASGIFIWARLVLERVLDLERQRAPWEKIEEEIRSIPPDIDSLYMDHLQRMNDAPASLRLIQWICFAKQPLSLIELYWALAIGTDNSHKSLHQYGGAKEYGNDDDMERRVIALSCGLIESVQSEDNERVVQFIHQSVKEFFMEKGLVALDESSTSPGVAIGMGHFQLSRTCIRYLTMEEIVQATAIFRGKKELRADFPFLYYAATSLVAHLQQYDALDLPQECILEIFGWPSDVIVQQWGRAFWLVRRYDEKGPPKGAGLLHVLAQHEVLQPIIAILQNASQTSVKVDLKDRYGRTPLSWVAENGHEAVVKLLISTGQVDVDSKDRYSQTPLSWPGRCGFKGCKWPDAAVMGCRERA
ncbi:nacht and ankyrin domain-containing protein [Trichoderma barbatum]